MYICRNEGLFGDAYKKHQFLREIYNGGQILRWQNCNSYVLSISDENPVLRNDSDFSVEVLGSTDDYLQEYGSGKLPFSLRFNPTFGRARHGVLASNLDSWVKEEMHSGMLSNLGAKLTISQLFHEGKVVLSKKDCDMTFMSAFMSGILKVEDMLRFKEVIRGGIGHGKAFGFGMLNIFGFI